MQVERFSAEVQVTEARCFYGFQITIEVTISSSHAQYVNSRIVYTFCGLSSK